MMSAAETPVGLRTEGWLLPERQCPKSQHPKESTLKVQVLELSFGSRMIPILYSFGEKWFIDVQIQGEKVIQGCEYQGYGSLG